MIVFRLPLAPPLSKLYTRQRHLTGVYKAWRTEAGLELNGQRAQYKGAQALPFKYGMTVCLDLPYIAQGDLDNRFKATLDLLVAHDILSDDKMKVIHAIAACWREEYSKDRMKVTLFDKEELDGRENISSRLI